MEPLHGKASWRYIATGCLCMRVHRERPVLSEYLILVLRFVRICQKCILAALEMSSMMIASKGAHASCVAQSLDGLAYACRIVIDVSMMLEASRT